jgi:energy-coupling factor transport system ATP-binding protein
LEIELRSIIRIENLHYTYVPEKGDPVQALRGVNLEIAEGEYVVIVGHNGSGKSTLAKHLNALLLPTQGDVWVNELNTHERKHWREIRSTLGMVFQVPDNQIVATIVEEDVAFGPENLGVPREEIIRRVDWALDRVEMQPFRMRPPHTLSGGQKQRICIAGTLAMKPRVLVLDEATTMLDPTGRAEVLEIARRLNKDEGVTIVAITHLMEEAVDADRLIVMSEGQLVLQGSPREVFAQKDLLETLHIAAPQLTRLAHGLHQQNPIFPKDVLSIEEFVAAARQHLRVTRITDEHAATRHLSQAEPETIIEINHLAHDYGRDTPMQHRALHDVSLQIKRGEVLGIIGHTGSGKSTVVQHMNGLMRPHEGSVHVFEHDLSDKHVDIRAVRGTVGLVFQFPESQLFEQFVGDDVAYGPRNLKLSREDVRARVKAAMEAVGLGFEAFKDRMTFQLSGGQKRRIAIAGVLALQPQVLVLDEPTAGLDPQARAKLLAQLAALNEAGTTLVIVSHNMEELAAVCDRVCVMNEGRTVLIGTPREVFSKAEWLTSLGLGVPPITQALSLLGVNGVLTMDEAHKVLG